MPGLGRETRDGGRFCPEWRSPEQARRGRSRQSCLPGLSPPPHGHHVLHQKIWQKSLIEDPQVISESFHSEKSIVMFFIKSTYFLSGPTCMWEQKDFNKGMMLSLISSKSFHHFLNAEVLSRVLVLSLRSQNHADTRSSCPKIPSALRDITALPSTF